MEVLHYGFRKSILKMGFTRKSHRFSQFPILSGKSLPQDIHMAPSRQKNLQVLTITGIFLPQVIFILQAEEYYTTFSDAKIFQKPVSLLRRKQEQQGGLLRYRNINNRFCNWFHKQVPLPQVERIAKFMLNFFFRFIMKIQ